MAEKTQQKNVKKAPAKNLKEKRQEKQAKSDAKSKKGE